MDKNDNKSQKEIILEHIRFRPITTWEAITLYRITRLAAVIKLLEKDGHVIARRKVKRENKKWTEYWLDTPPEYQMSLPTR